MKISWAVGGPATLKNEESKYRLLSAPVMIVCMYVLGFLGANWLLEFKNTEE